MENPELEQTILDFIQRPGYQPVKPRVIARKLGLAKGETVAVRKAVKRLIRQGKLVHGPKHLVGPVDPKLPGPGRVVGVFRRKDAGFGFVRPTGVAGSEAEVSDIYIPAGKARDAATGDMVAVELSSKRGQKHPGPRGRIVEIIQRQTHQFVGTYTESAGAAYVEVDGAVFSNPICVGDPGVHRVQPGDKVVLEMVRFPSHLRDGEGVITEVLGRAGQPGVDTLTILREFNLSQEFPEGVLEQARRLADRWDETVPPGRHDATAEVVLTIDPADAKDFDDAISLVRLDNGHWRLGVHIADVSHFVRPNTALDREARQRATSVYLPDQVIPMLPEVISNGLASLQPGKVRLTKSVYIEMTAEGQPVATEAFSAAIKSNKRLTYEQVDQFLADPEPWRRKLGLKVHSLLDRMRQLARILRQRRIQRGALELAMPEVKVELDKKGRVVGARVVPYTESHQIIEEFMLAANEAVAELLARKETLFLRRVHPAPTQRKLDALTEFVRELGLASESLESRFELQKLLTAVQGCPQQHAVHYAVLRSFQRTVYSPHDAGHYALASHCYCHFTSPIRRYPDLTVHRLLEQILEGTKPPTDFDALVVEGEHCSEREERAEAAERELTKLKLLNYLSGRVGEQMDAVVTGVERFGLFVQGLELPAEGLVHIASLDDDFYQYDRTTHTLAGRRAGNTFRLGDLVRVSVHRVDLERRELDFRLAGRRARAAPKADRKRGETRKPAAKKKPVKSTKTPRRRAARGGKRAT